MEEIITIVHDPNNITFLPSRDMIGVEVEPYDLNEVEVYDLNGNLFECEIQHVKEKKKFLKIFNITVEYEKVVLTGISDKNSKYSKELRTILLEYLSSNYGETDLDQKSVEELIKIGFRHQ